MNIITLNCEYDRHFSRIFPFFQQEQPDILCIQEIFEADVPLFQENTGLQHVIFAANSIIDAPNRYGIPTRGPWGIAIFSKLPFVRQQTFFYKGEADIIPNFIDGNPNSNRRALLAVTVEDDQAQPLTIATTHFTWTPDGNTSDEQRAQLPKILEIIDGLKPCVLTGDFNAPRGKEIFDTLAKHLVDHVPTNVTSTIDETLHYAQLKLDIVVDGFFASPKISIQKVRAIRGVSDHCAIVGEVSEST